MMTNDGSLCPCGSFVDDDVVQQRALSTTDATNTFVVLVVVEWTRKGVERHQYCHYRLSCTYTFCGGDCAGPCR